MLPPFANEPLTDFSDPASSAAYREALAQVRRQLGRHGHLIADGKQVDTGKRIVSINPARPKEIVGTAAAAAPDHADLALEAAWKAFPAWAGRGVADRAALLVKLAAEMRRRKLILAAWETLEGSKNWVEADADVAEAIDFCEYYARQALEFAKPLPVHPFPGEINQSWLQPLGAGVVLAPWNFPLAILVGMVIGPVAAGNTVVVKPSSYTPLVGSVFMEIAASVGFPPGVINFLPGMGNEVGDYLVDHPRTRFINFTGSREVGVRIMARAAQIHPGQQWLKRVYTELGGKDAVVIDETADLDAAIPEVIKSAFGFQGQKCSAASRLIVAAEVYEEVLERLAAAVKDIQVGPAEENFPVGAMISEAQHKMILTEIERGKGEGRLIVGGQPIDRDGGYYIAPTVFADVIPSARLAQQEIFGPVLAVIRAADFDEAVSIFNGTEYGLTGGLFSRSRDRLDRAKREFNVGNLYLNRKITGALVGVQPFGGFKMSGSNAKAGGPDYLRLFLEMKTVSERL
ncbi:MAG: L-glutamate gamma-semialdehyde dehydrogenase [Thermodesulfobacteriota bacterium]